MKPFIGILPSYTYEAKQIFLNKAYLDEIMASGAVPYVLPLTSDEETISEILSHIDGIIFSGGSDINPNYYGKEDTGKSKEINPLRDECEETYIKIALKKDMPILGICRGMQALNVFCGGSLIEDIPSEYKIETIHNLEKPDIAFHKITVLPDTPLADIIGAGVHTVNSYHHQAVDSLAPYFSIVQFPKTESPNPFFVMTNVLSSAFSGIPNATTSRRNAIKLLLTDLSKSVPL